MAAQTTTEPTFSAATTCSGEIVFFASFSQISLASEEIRVMNSDHASDANQLAASRRASAQARTLAAFCDQLLRVLGAHRFRRENLYTSRSKRSTIRTDFAYKDSGRWALT